MKDKHTGKPPLVRARPPPPPEVGGPGAGSGLGDAEWRGSLHYVGVLCPTVATAGCGKTEVKVASHRVGDQPAAAVATLGLEPGDALVLDGRALHRGLSNPAGSGVVRTLAFFTFKEPRFEDCNHHAYLG